MHETTNASTPNSQVKVFTQCNQKSSALGAYLGMVETLGMGAEVRDVAGSLLLI